MQLNNLYKKYGYKGYFRKILIKINSNSIRNKRRPIVSSFITKAMDGIMQSVE